MSISNDIKKSIAKDWLNEFSQLSAFAQDKLYKIVGPIIIGIEVFKQPRADDYRPYFVSYPLWKSDLKNCLEEPTIIQEMRNKKGLQFDIPYSKHSNYFLEVVECTKTQVLIPFDEDINIKSLFEMINNQFTYTLVRSSPVQQAELYVFKLFSALYVNNEFLIKDVLSQIQKAGKNWQPNLFEWKFGAFDKWLQGLENKVNERDDFLNQIDVNKQDKKLQKLKSSELKV